MVPIITFFDGKSLSRHKQRFYNKHFLEGMLRISTLKLKLKGVTNTNLLTLENI